MPASTKVIIVHKNVWKYILGSDACLLRLQDLEDWVYHQKLNKITNH